MKEKKIVTRIHVYGYDELPETDRQLVDYAKRMVGHSYSPYSHFQVGAAARLASGKIVGGANQENAAYPSGLCAERTALFAANAQYPEEAVESIAIAAFTDGEFVDEPIPPCGGCRQVMLETENRYGGKMRVLLYGKKHVFLFDSATDLMPLTFLKEDLLGEE